ncbi:MAG: glycine/D-amino acid oxidase-like deaminating enzyme, partial [Colwellia sp.]
MYDPLHDKSPGCGEAYPDSYWAENADIQNNAPQSDGQISQDVDVDVAIIGAGYTGLSCALHLAREHGIKAHVLEANQTAWGCSGRNAGFILKSSGRKSYSDMAQKWGEEVMRGIYDEMFLKVSHKPSKLAELISQAKLQQKTFAGIKNSDVEILTKNEVRQQYMDDKNAYGAIRYQDGFGLNPLKLAWGYQRLAREAGAKVHTSSPVLEILDEG